MKKYERLIVTSIEIDEKLKKRFTFGEGAEAIDVTMRGFVKFKQYFKTDMPTQEFSIHYSTVLEIADWIKKMIEEE